MKKVQFLSIIFLFIRLTTFAQWELLDHNTMGVRLSTVVFVDENIGYATGDYGAILKTTDAGTTWINQYSGTGDNF